MIAEVFGDQPEEVRPICAMSIGKNHDPEGTSGYRH